MPEEAVVFGAMNRVKKIDKETWGAWIRVLSRVEGSVLWLSRLAVSNQTEARLRRAAEEVAVGAGDRLVFTETFPAMEHVAIKGLADVALDTRVYNGHVTTGDALWGDLPVVVLPGVSMASRLSSSFWTPLPEGILVARSLEDYQDIAVALTRSREALRQRREEIAAAKLSSPLFDTSRWVMRLERALRMILEGAEGGDLVVAD
mmetsp:Transcript_41776/g.104424  ORF Transcript_41776/g.104424 Transcript_41776/m.104424 type:complete len:204 (-) Transcript_41776:567-1178(-)